MKQYNKLIRDRITELIEKDGLEFKTRILDDKEYKQELLKKIVEEAQEVFETTTREDLITELADVLEVIEAIVVANDFNPSEIEKVRMDRKEKRGGFKKKIFLEKMEEKKTD